MKTIMSEMEHTLDGINSRLDIAKETIKYSNKRPKMKYREKKNKNKMKRASVTHGTISSSLIYM